MSSNLYATVGLYIRIKNGNVECEQLVPIITCPNANCKQHGKTVNSAFCAACGRPIGKVLTERKVKPDINDIEGIEDLGDPFCGTEYNYNEKKDLILPYNYESFFNTDDTAMLSLEDMIAGKEDCMASYNSKPEAQQYLALLKKQFGDENVELGYGLLVAWW